jgi:hypothetical protein
MRVSAIASQSKHGLCSGLRLGTYEVQAAHVRVGRSIVHDTFSAIVVLYCARSSLEVLRVPFAMSEYVGCQVNYAKASELCADSSSHAPMHYALLQQQSWLKGGPAGIRSIHRANSRHNLIRIFSVSFSDDHFVQCASSTRAPLNRLFEKTMYSRFCARALGLYVDAQRPIALWGLTSRGVQVSARARAERIRYG